MIRTAERLGLKIILSSARTRLELGMASSLFDATGPVVAENGGIVWYHSTGEEKVLGDLGKAQEAYEAASSRIPDLQLLQEGFRETDVMVRGKRAPEITPIVKAEGLDVHLLESAHVTCIAASSASKGIGLKVASEMIGIDPSQVAAIQVAAIGDAHNDVTLFETAGAGYAIGNADQRLKDVATKVMSRPYGEAAPTRSERS
jgi:hydroxymethylpyrimidine pyrophosphatase-like HAD family hydrolase